MRRVFVLVVRFDLYCFFRIFLAFEFLDLEMKKCLIFGIMKDEEKRESINLRCVGFGIKFLF